MIWSRCNPYILLRSAKLWGIQRMPIHMFRHANYCTPQMSIFKTLLMYQRNLTRFGMLILSTNLSLLEFPYRFSALLLYFLATDSFMLLCMGSICKSVLMLVFLKIAIWTLLFFCYVLKIFLMLPVILLSPTGNTIFYSKFDQTFNL